MSDPALETAPPLESDSQSMDACISGSHHFPFFQFDPKPGGFVRSIIAFITRHRLARDRADFRQIRSLIRDAGPIRP